MRSVFQVSLYEPLLHDPCFENGYRVPYNNAAVKASKCAHGELATSTVQQFVRWNLRWLSFVNVNDAVVREYLSGTSTR